MLATHSSNTIIDHRLSWQLLNFTVNDKMFRVYCILSNDKITKYNIT